MSALLSTCDGVPVESVSTPFEAAAFGNDAPAPGTANSKGPVRRALNSVEPAGCTVGGFLRRAARGMKLERIWLDAITMKVETASDTMNGCDTLAGSGADGVMIGAGTSRVSSCSRFNVAKLFAVRHRLAVRATTSALRSPRQFEYIAASSSLFCQAEQSNRSYKILRHYIQPNNRARNLAAMVEAGSPSQFGKMQTSGRSAKFLLFASASATDLVPWSLLPTGSTLSFGTLDLVARLEPTPGFCHENGERVGRIRKANSPFCKNV
jgi:hypothetical protein